MCRVCFVTFSVLHISKKCVIKNKFNVQNKSHTINLETLLGVAEIAFNKIEGEN